MTMDTRHIIESKKRQIENGLEDLFAEVTAALEQAIQCLVKMDENVCQSLVELEAGLNEKWRVVEQDCLIALASQQPMASDLRDIVAEMHIGAELNRMGDYGCDIAASILEMDDTPIESLGLLEVQMMASICQQMAHNVLRAHKNGDVALANRVIDTDDELDILQKKLIGVLMAAMRADPANVQNGSRMLWIAHNLERYGDRAVNIARQVVFRIEG